MGKARLGKSILQGISKILKRPVGPDESAMKVQEEVLKKQNRAGARSISKSIKSLPSDSAALKKKIKEFNKGVKKKKPVIDERLEDLLAASRNVTKPTKRPILNVGTAPKPFKKSRVEKVIENNPGLVGPAGVVSVAGVVGADRFVKDTRKRREKATAKRDKTSTFMKRRRKKDQITEFLYGGQAKIDANTDGKITGEDFKQLRANKKRFGGMAIKGVKENPPIY